MNKAFYENQTAIAYQPQNILSYTNFPQKCIQAVYANLISLISEYAESKSFTEAPDGSDSLIYFRCRIDKIESMIHQIRNAPKLVSDLLSVTRAIKHMICTCDFPGVPSSWYKINPNLRFYSAAFKIMVESPEVYEQILNGQSPLSLDYYPKYSEIALYYQYFSKLNKINEDGNYHYTENNFFQIELVETIKAIFENILNENGYA